MAGKQKASPLAQEKYGDAVGISREMAGKKLDQIYGDRLHKPSIKQFVLDYCRVLRQEASGRGFDSGIAKQRERKEAAQAERLERENLEAAQKLVLVEDVEKAYSEIALQIRNALLAMPSAVAGAVAEMSDERQILNFLTDEVRQVLTNLADR